MSKHTPGNWTPAAYGDYGDYNGQCRVILGDDLRVAVVLGYDDEETNANAHLIAAAPDLLEALEVAVNNFCGGEQQLHQMMAAIAKARGEK